MDTLQIEYDSPRSVYFPGQTVTGRVIIETREPIKARFLKVCIHGAAETHWTESESRSRTNANGETESYTETIHYSGRVIYLQGQSFSWTAVGENNKFPVGRSIFPFSFVLPLNIPPSFEGFHGFIRYSVHVELDRPWKFNKRTKKCFSVVPSFDLNLIPQAILPMASSASKNTGLIFKNGIVNMIVNLPKQGFVPGEILPITVVIDNGSKKPVVMIRAKLNQMSTYHARRGYGNDFTLSSKVSHCCVKHEKKLVAERRQDLNIPPKSKSQVVLSIRIPAVVPSFNICPILSVEYCLSVNIDTTSTFGSTVKSRFPLIIGTIPIIQYSLPSAHRPTDYPGPSVPSAPTDDSPTAPPLEMGSGSAPPYPESSDAPPPYPINDSPNVPPPSYEESMYGTAGTTKNTSDTEPFAPRYPVYRNLQEADPLPVKL